MGKNHYETVLFYLWLNQVEGAKSIINSRDIWRRPISILFGKVTRVLLSKWVAPMIIELRFTRLSKWDSIMTMDRRVFDFNTVFMFCMESSTGHCLIKILDFVSNIWKTITFTISLSFGAMESSTCHLWVLRQFPYMESNTCHMWEI